nr:HEAT repeat domain-containing protein [Mesorhizobium norvegicum]
MALELADGEKVAQAVEFARLTADDAKGLVGALAWHKPAAIGPSVREWIGGQDAFTRFLGVSSCIVHNVDPGATLARLVKDNDSRVRAAALRLVGQLRRFDLGRDVQSALEHGDERVRLWASWALVELGSGDLTRQELRKIATAAGPDAMVAMRALVKAGPDRDVRAWMGGLMKSPSTAPIAVRGIGMLGDRSVLGWLVERMKEPPLALAATASFLELFPEARQESKLFTGDPPDLGKSFATFFADRIVILSLAEKVSEWAGLNALGPANNGPQ